MSNSLKNNVLDSQTHFRLNQARTIPNYNISPLKSNFTIQYIQNTFKHTNFPKGARDVEDFKKDTKTRPVRQFGGTK